MDLENGTTIGEIAATFHYTLVILIKKIAKANDFNQITFSGGVFQNSLLIDLIQIYLENDYKLYFHRELSPNDENISFGQLVCYLIERKKNNSI